MFPEITYAQVSVLDCRQPANGPVTPGGPGVNRSPLGLRRAIYFWHLGQ